MTMLADAVRLRDLCERKGLDDRGEKRPDSISSPISASARIARPSSPWLNLTPYCCAPPKSAIVTTRSGPDLTKPGVRVREIHDLEDLRGPNRPNRAAFIVFPSATQPPRVRERLTR
jgi:hypothetical protein